MRHLHLGGTIILLAGLAASTAAYAHSGAGMMTGYGSGMMPGGMNSGYGCGMAYMMGPGAPSGDATGMMGGPGAWRGMAQRGWIMPQRDLNLSADNVKAYFSQLIAVQDNPRLKVGDVVQADDATITADIVTKQENALVQRFLVNRHSGFYQPSED